MSITLHFFQQNIFGMKFDGVIVVEC